MKVTDWADCRVWAKRKMPCPWTLFEKPDDDDDDEPEWPEPEWFAVGKRRKGGAREYLDRHRYATKVTELSSYREASRPQGLPKMPIPDKVAAIEMLRQLNKPANRRVLKEIGIPKEIPMTILAVTLGLVVLVATRSPKLTTSLMLGANRGMAHASAYSPTGGYTVDWKRVLQFAGRVPGRGLFGWTAKDGALGHAYPGEYQYDRPYQ